VLHLPVALRGLRAAGARGDGGGDTGGRLAGRRHPRGSRGRGPARRRAAAGRAGGGDRDGAPPRRPPGPADRPGPGPGPAGHVGGGRPPDAGSLRERAGRTRPGGRRRGAMRVAFDARKLADFGIGTYIQGLLREFATLGVPEELVVYRSPRVEVPTALAA